MIASRPYNKLFGGFYEFPGGKVKKNEFLKPVFEKQVFAKQKVRGNEVLTKKN